MRLDIQKSVFIDAIMDRLIHRSHRLELSGESMRKKQSLNLAKQE
ncbi:ATP-binding protein [Endozoicomonas acroporae]